MKIPKLQFATWFLVGIAVCSMIYIGMRILRPHLFNPLASRAKQIGYEPHAYIQVTELRNRVRTNPEISAEEVDVLRQSANDQSNQFIRDRAVTALEMVRGPQQSVALDILHEKLSDPSSVVRMGALGALFYNHVEDMPSILLRMKQDVDPDVVDLADKYEAEMQGKHTDTTSAQ